MRERTEEVGVDVNTERGNMKKNQSKLKNKITEKENILEESMANQRMQNGPATGKTG